MHPVLIQINNEKSPKRESVVDGLVTSNCHSQFVHYSYRKIMVSNGISETAPHFSLLHLRILINKKKELSIDNKLWHRSDKLNLLAHIYQTQKAYNLV